MDFTFANNTSIVTEESLEKKLGFQPLIEDNENRDLDKVKKNEMKTVTLKDGIED